MPRLYRAGTEWFAAQRDAMKAARHNGCSWQAVDVDPTVKGLLALLNSRRHAAPDAPPAQPDGPREPQSAGDPGGQPWTGERAEIAIRSWVAAQTDGAAFTAIQLQRHLERDHRIAVSTLWIAERLIRLGCPKHCTKGITLWFPPAPAGELPAAAVGAGA